MTDRTIAQLHGQFLSNRIQAISNRLRDLADEVDRHAQHIDIGRVPAPGLATYGSIAARVQHTVLWGLANLSLDGLVTEATDADIARVNGQ